MTRLVALYPRAWRDRYEDEFLALMADRPDGPLDRIDILRGAVDARIHPQLQPSSSGEPERANSARFDALLAVVAGLLWVAAALAFLGSSVDPELGYKETGSALVLGIAGALVAGLAALVLSRSLPGQHAGASVAAGAAVIGALAMVLPWPVLLFGFWTSNLSIVIFGLAAIRRLGFSGTLLSMASVLAFGFNAEDERALLLVPLGAAWIVAGSVLATRRAQAALNSPSVEG
jgi:hypothetical protein